MKRVESNGDWTLFCPDEAPGLHEVWGDEFEALYHQYEKEGRGRQTIKAQALWYKIIEAQIEAGVPYMVYKVMTHFPCYLDRSFLCCHVIRRVRYIFR